MITSNTRRRRVRDLSARAATLLRNRLAAGTSRSATLRAAYARGKAAGRVLHGDLASVRGVVRTDADELRRQLSRTLVADSTGRAVPAEDLDRLRRLAIDNRVDDQDGSSLAALSLLADRFDDRTARAWLVPSLADAGRFEEAAAVPLSFAPGRPRARGYVIAVTALHQLGRTGEAEQRMRFLERKFAGLREEFVHIWDGDPVSRHYRALYERSPARSGALPVFQHLPFCAGSSMQFALRQVVPWARTLQIGRRWGMLQIEQARQLPPAAIAELMMVHQHHPFALELAGRRLSHFTVLRDPVSQIRSGFFKRQARDTIVGTRDVGSATFAEHAEYTMSHGLTNMLARMIVTTHPELQAVYRREFGSSGAYTMISNEEDMFWVRATRKLGESRLLQLCRETLDEFAVVGTMAHLSASHLACTAAVGVPVAHTIGHRGRSGQPRTVAPEPIEARLREANAVDQQLYEEYTARFERDHAGLITAVEGDSGGFVDDHPDDHQGRPGSAAERLEQLGDGLAVVQ
jgi:hypothetical protein